MRFVKTILFMLTSFVTMSACSTDKKSERSPETLPARTSQDLRDIGKIGTNNLSSTKFSVDLSQNPRPDQWGTVGCRLALPPDFVLGQITCAARPELKANLVAAQAFQTCANPAVAPIEPTASIELAGCDGDLGVSVFNFAPNLPFSLTSP